MNKLNDAEYYVARAAASRQLAQRATSPAIAAIHDEMASKYESTAAQMAAGRGTPSPEAQAD